MNTGNATPARRHGPWLDLGLFLAALLVLLVAIVALARHPSLRREIDATKTRAYSLSPQTERLLDSLEGDWVIALVHVADRTDRAVRRQVDEVLERFAGATPRLSVLRVDPTDPRSLRDYEALLERLRSNQADLIDAYDRAIAGGTDAFEELCLFAQQQANVVAAVAGRLPEGPVREGLARRAGLLTLLAENGDAVIGEVRSALRVDASRPLPDHETARSILAEALARGAQEIHDVALLLEQAREAAGDDDELRRALAGADRAWRDVAARIAGADDPLALLEPLEIARVGRRLQQGEAAIVIGPRRAAVIPADRLLPPSGGAAIAFDQRFRGEQLIAGAIRNLRGERTPAVIFVHAEGRSMLKSHQRDVDLVGVASMLEAAGWPVREWIVHETERPAVDPDDGAVWVIVPAPEGQGVDPTPPQRELLAATRRLVEEGEAVLLSLYPSLAPGFGRGDPWAGAALPFGIAGDTGRVVMEQQRTGERETTLERGVSLSRYAPEHPITEAIRGLRTYFALPVPLRFDDSVPAQKATVVAIPASDDRWLERQWSQSDAAIVPPPAEGRLAEPVTVVAAAERPHPVARRTQRCVVVGSGGWMLSYVADVAVSTGGDRFALVNPGNHELMLAATAWLAGRDDLLAPSPAGQGIARIAGLTPGAAQRWTWTVLALLPALALGTGLIGWWRRR